MNQQQNEQNSKPECSEPAYEARPPQPRSNDDYNRPTVLRANFARPIPIPQKLENPGPQFPADPPLELMDTTSKLSETSYLRLVATHHHQRHMLLASDQIPFQLKEQLQETLTFPQDPPL